MISLYVESNLKKKLIEVKFMVMRGGMWGEEEFEKRWSKGTNLQL